MTNRKPTYAAVVVAGLQRVDESTAANPHLRWSERLKNQCSSLLHLHPSLLRSPPPLPPPSLQLLPFLGSRSSPPSLPLLPLLPTITSNLQETGLSHETPPDRTMPVIHHLRPIEARVSSSLSDISSDLTSLASDESSQQTKRKKRPRFVILNDSLFHLLLVN